MAKTRTEKIEGIQAQIQQLENERKKLLQQQKEQERKDKTKRQAERGAILESFISGADTLTNEQIKSFLQKTVQSEYARKILDGLKKRPSDVTISKSSEIVPQIKAS